MNWAGGWAIIRKTWLSWIQHRGFFFLLAFMWMIPSIIYLFVWTTAAGGGRVGGYSRGLFVGYYLVFIVVNQLTYSQTNWTVGDQIRAGTMNIHLLRPISPFFDALASELAGKVVYLSFILPITILLGWILKPDISLTPGVFIQFVAALFLAWGLRFLWGYWIALLAFWATRANALLAVQDSLVFLLGGQLAPTALLSSWMKNAALFLPFRYMIGFPVEIIAGNLSISEINFGFTVQSIWVLFTFVLFVIVWRAGVKQYSAVGG
jgi:ABC-2 type transport system permease protein